MLNTPNYREISKGVRDNKCVLLSRSKEKKQREEIKKNERERRKKMKCKGRDSWERENEWIGEKG